MLTEEQQGQWLAYLVIFGPIVFVVSMAVLQILMGLE